MADVDNIPLRLEYEGSGLSVWLGQYCGVRILKQESVGEVARRRFGFEGTRVALDDGDWTTVEEAKRTLAGKGPLG